MESNIQTIINNFNINYANFECNYSNKINSYNNINIYDLLEIFLSCTFYNKDFTKNLPSLHNYMNYKTITIKDYKKIKAQKIINFIIDKNRKLTFKEINNKYYSILQKKEKENLIIIKNNINPDVIKTYINYIDKNYNNIQSYYFMKNSIIRGNFDSYLIFNIKNNELKISYTGGSYNQPLCFSIIYDISQKKIVLNDFLLEKTHLSFNDKEIINILNHMYIDLNNININIKNIYQNTKKSSNNIINIDEYLVRKKNNH